jgi:transcription initiation factor TFIIIB Brf1 subunit/transcription initiation factor TFIIB
MHDKDLGSQISWSNKDAKGNTLKGKAQLSRMRKWDSEMQLETKEQNNRTGLGHIHRLSSALELSKPTVKKSAEIFHKAHEEELAVGPGLYEIAVACVFVASRQEGIIRGMEEWEEKTGLSKHRIHKRVTKVQKNLDVGYEPVMPMDYVENVLADFSLSEDKREQVYSLVKKAQEENIHIGKRPQGVVGAAIYMAKEHITQEQVAEKVGLSPKTIRSSYKELC